MPKLNISKIWKQIQSQDFNLTRDSSLVEKVKNAAITSTEPAHVSFGTSGWHLPTMDEWDALESYIQTDKGCTECSTKHLKSTSGWIENGNGLDSYI